MTNAITQRSSMFEAFSNLTLTNNGAKAQTSSGSANIDLFFQIGASRGKDITPLFLKALQENPEYALRTVQWVRDIRQGQGEREQFRKLLAVALTHNNVSFAIRERARLILSKIPELGRYDDLLWFAENIKEPIRSQAISIFVEGLRNENGLAYKWAPIKGRVAYWLRKAMGFYNEASWRKHVVSNRSTVEQIMCAKEWSIIDYSKLPSVASARYQKAFARNDNARYASYLNSVEKGEAKINAGALYPYDIIRSLKYGVETAANVQWNALPDFLEGIEGSVLPLVDTSGSMQSNAAGKNGSVSCRDVAVSLGLYLAERLNGPFKDHFLTFSKLPKMQQIQGSTLKERVNSLDRASWNYDTNIQAAFEALLTFAIAHKVPVEYMPNTIVIFSDMQFNECITDGQSVSAFNMIKAKYAQTSYKCPNIVFWNLHAANNNTPVSINTSGVALVSGFSATLMKSLFSNTPEIITPEQTFLNTIMVDRYSLN